MSSYVYSMFIASSLIRESRHLGIYEELKKANVPFSFFYKDNIIQIRIDTQYADRLPTDSHGFYLPLTDDTGTSLFSDDSLDEVSESHWVDGIHILNLDDPTVYIGGTQNEIIQSESLLAKLIKERIQNMSVMRYI